MRIGILGDLHIGGTGEGRWHNRLLLDQAENIARASVSQLNQQDLDLVVVLGDLTNAGTADTLGVVRDILSSLSVPWYVVPGNHDTPALETGSFNRAFGPHVPAQYCCCGHIGMVFFTQLLPVSGGLGDLRVDLDMDRAVMEQMEMHQPAALLVFSHYPLASEGAYALRQNAAYAGHVRNGPDVLRQTARLARGKVVVFCGHLHWHHVKRSSRWVQCSTAAMIEYPMECRLVSVEGDVISVSTLPTASPGAATESLDSSAWVRGRESDRAFDVRLNE